MSIDTSKPLLSGTAALVVGTIGGLLATAAAFVPPPWGFVVGLVGFVAAVLAGAAAKPPSVVEGKPVLQGVALTVATSAAGLLEHFWGVIPQGWPQSLALGGAALLAFLTGRALPALGTKSPAPVAHEHSPSTTAEAVEVFRRGPQP